MDNLEKVINEEANKLKSIEERYIKLIDEYTKQYTPNVSDVWHTDEQIIKVKGVQKYVWNCMDNKTRFLLTFSVLFLVIFQIFSRGHIV